MQTIEFNSYLGSVNDLFPCSSCLVIGVGSGSYIHTLEGLDFQDVILVDADEQQLQKMQKMHSVPSSYVVKNTLVYKDEANIPFYIATNPTVSCFKLIDTYKPLMPNVSLLETKELRGYALATFIQSFEDKKINWLIIDTFTALEILSESKESLDALEVIVCKILSETTDSLHVFMLEHDFKLVKYFEENNPKVGMAVYVKDYSAKNAKSEMQKFALEKQLQAEQKIVNSLKESAAKETEALKVQKAELQQKVTSYQEEQKIVQNREKEVVAKFETQKNQLGKQLTETQNALERLQETSAEEKKKLEIQSNEFKKKLELSTAEKKEFETKLASQKNDLEKQLQNEKENLAKQLEKSKSENKSLEANVALSEDEYTQTEYVLNQISKEASYSEVILVALAENALKHKKYQKVIYYWQELAAVLGNKMPQLYYKRLSFAYSHIGGYPPGSEEEEVLSGSYDKHEFLAQLHNILDPEFYLEIGVQTGKSLRLAHCKALGVDPMPLLNEELTINMEVQTQTSDAFFATYAKTVLTEPLDLVFIDGMHLFEYALRDFMNVETYASKNTTIVIDDIYPGHPSQANRDRQTRAWTGDVWKVLAILKKYRKDLKIVTLDIYPTGLMMIQNLDKDSSVLKDNYEKIVKKYVEKKIDKERYIKRKGSLDPALFIDDLKKENSEFSKKSK